MNLEQALAEAARRWPGLDWYDEHLTLVALFRCATTTGYNAAMGADVADDWRAILALADALAKPGDPWLREFTLAAYAVGIGTAAGDTGEGMARASDDVLKMARAVGVQPPLADWLLAVPPVVAHVLTTTEAADSPPTGPLH